MTGAELQAPQVQSAGAEVCTPGPEQVTVLEVEAFRGDRGGIPGVTSTSG